MWPPDCTAPRQLKVAAQSPSSLDWTWQAPSPNCHPTEYQYRQKAEGLDWPLAQRTDSPSRHAESELSADTWYTFQVWAVNAAGEGTAAQITAKTPQSNTPDPPDPPDPPPTNTPGRVSLSPATPKAGEQVTATLTDPDDPITGGLWRWTYSECEGATGTTADSSAVTGAGMDTRVIDIPSDKAGCRLQVTANYTDRDGPQTARSDKSGRITAPAPPPPTDTRGRVTLSTASPQAGQSITATLSDPDGPTNVRWSWLYFSAGATRASDESEGETPPEEGETPPGEGEAPDEEGAPPDEGEGEPPASAKPVFSTLAAAPDSVLVVVSAPNPFNPSTTLHVQLPTSGPASLTLYSLSGQVVRRLMEGWLAAGAYAYEWDGHDGQGQPVSSGVYLYRLRAGDQTFVGKVTLIR